MPVLFSESLSKLLAETDSVFLEVGPRDVLTTLARQCADQDRRERMIASLGGGATEDDAEWTSLLSAIGRLWANGISLDWNGFFGREKRRRYPYRHIPSKGSRIGWIRSRIGCLEYRPAISLRPRITLPTSPPMPDPEKARRRPTRKSRALRKLPAPMK